ncbi:cilia- and flagella-associated protein 46 isoform X3 [Ciona intestinalis]
MDANIRQLLAIAVSSDEGEKYVIESYNLLQQAHQKSKDDDGPDVCGSDLYIQCAEVALKLQQFKICQECLHMYFNGTTLSNQFLCRAYLCQAQLLAPKSAESVTEFETASVYILKAVNFAKDKPRYHFLVYNASVLYWQMARPFLRPGFRALLHPSLQQVVSALEMIDDKDYEWRGTLMIALIESLVDANCMKEAATSSHSAAQFTLNRNPVMFKDVFKLQIKHKLVDLNKLAKEMRGMPQYIAFFKLQRIKLAVEDKSKSDVMKELPKLVQALCGRPGSKPSSLENRRKSTQDEIIAIFPEDRFIFGMHETSYSFHPLFVSLLCNSFYCFVFCVIAIPTTMLVLGLYNCYFSCVLAITCCCGLCSVSVQPAAPAHHRASRKQSQSKVAISYKADPVSISESQQSILEVLIRPYLLIDVARLCIEIDQVAFARDCLNAFKDCEITDSGLLVEIEFLECEMIVKQLGDKQEAYSKSSVEVRLSAIKRMEQALENAVRSGNANVVQGACATQWNLCLPLLQRNLRKHVRRPLTAVAKALEDISSLQVTLRCRVHTELAKCEEAVEQIEAAVKHVNKALELDDSGFYHERLQTMLHRLQLSTQLYRTPDRPEDVAAIIIEQARKSSESGSVRMKRSLLVKAGLALAPDAFQYVLDSENETKASGGMKGLVSEVQTLGARARQWSKCVKKAPGHLKRLGDENDRERSRLWVDLVKTARQQHVWDVCRVAATFCLLYDDARWKVNPKEKEPSEKESSKDKRRSANQSKAPGTGDSASVKGKSPDTDQGSTDSNLHDADLLRMLAEVHYINGEALIHLLRCEGLKLNESPDPPVDNRQRPKGHEYKKPEQEPEWAEYTDWIHHLNKQATSAFLRAIELGIELEETWIICSGAAYLWNYSNHLLVASRYTELAPMFQQVLFGMQQIGHSTEATLLVRICEVIAKGLIRPWIPKKSSLDSGAVTQATTAATKDTSRKKTAGKSTGNTAPGTTAGLAVDPDGMDDVKRALEVCEYGLQVTNGSNQGDIISTSVRHQLLATWVQVKQMLQQQISPGFGTDNEKIPEQRDMTKSLVMLEMLSLNRNDMMEFTVPEISEVCDVVDECSWNNSGVELEVWSRLAQLSRLQKNHSLVVRCSNNALALEQKAVNKKHVKEKQADIHKRTVALEMLAYASCIRGESLMDTCAANPSARRQAMHSFVDSAKFGERAVNFSLVMMACRRWWNAALPLIPSPLERELLRQPLEVLLISILRTANNAAVVDEPEDSGGKEKGVVKVIDGEGDGSSNTKQSIGVSLGDPSDDRTLRAAMYGLQFQTFADKGEWEEGLVVMDRALHHMPRTKHRLLLFKHRVIVKAKLGKNVQMDIAKFRDESEDYVSHMWHRVALCSRETLEQLMAFQKAIEALHSDDTQWQKFEYLLELATWMYSNEFSIDDTVNIVEWAADILINMKFHVELPEQTQVDRGKGKKGKMVKPASRAQPPPKTTESKPSSKQQKKTPASRQKKQDEPKIVEEEKHEEQHLPVEREAIIGVEPNNLNVKFEDLHSTRQLDGLIRSHVMMATVSGKGSKSHQTFCQLAYSFVMRLWKISLTSASVVMKHLPKPETTAADDTRKGSGAKKAKATPAQTAPTKERIKRKGPPDALPNSTSEWATYEPPDEIIKAFLFDTSDCGINKGTITCAGMTVFYLLKLSEYLRDCSLHNLSLPVLCLAAVITRGILQSDSWTQLINIQQITVCYELHLVNAAEQWENWIDNKFLTEQEQTTSKQELEMKQISKELAKQEEERIRKANGDALVQDTKTSSAKSTSSKKEPGPITLTGRKVGGVNLSEIWTQKAKVLLKLGYYQHCRSLLNEALTVANYNKDTVLLVDIYHGLADLATHEGNNGQAIQLLRKAQAIGGDELFWQENILLLIEAITLNQDPSPDDVVKVTKVIRRSLECLDKLSATRPTKNSTIGYLKSILIARSSFSRLASCTSQPAVYLRKLVDAERILQDLGFHRELASIHMEHAGVLLKLSKHNKEFQHLYILQAIKLLQTSVDNVTRLCNNVVPLETDKEVSLPIHREMMNLQLHFSSLLLDAAEVSADEDRLSKAAEAAKGALERFVENYVGTAESELNETDMLWNAQRTTFVHRAMSVLNTMHTQLPTQHVLRAKWMYLIGRSLRLCSEGVHPDDPKYQWEVEALLPEQMLRDVGIKSSTGFMSASMEEVNEMESTQQQHDVTSRQMKLFSNEAKTLDSTSEFSFKLLSQATEVFAQCINMSIQLQAIDIVSLAALEMVECCAQHDPHTATLYLALHQSAESSKTMKELVMKSVSDPSTSQLASLLHQDSWLMKGYISSGLDNCTVKKDIMKLLSDKFTAWKRLQLAPNHLDLLKDMPSNFNIIIMQHSPDKRTLYCGIMDKPKSSTSATDGKSKGKDKQTSSQTDASRASVYKIHVDPEKYNEMMDQHSDFQQRLMSFLLQSEYQRSQLAMRQKMLQQLSKSATVISISETALEEQAMEEMKLQEEFGDILNDMEKYVEPLSWHIKTKLLQPIIEQANQHLSTGQPLSELTPEMIIILAGPTLMQLPLEALKCLQTPHVDSVTRDFSLQMLHRRWFVDPEEAAAAAEKKRNDLKTAPKTPKGGKDAGKKGVATPAAKIVPLNRELPPDCASIDTHSFHYIVDPSNECSETEQYRPAQVFQQLLQMYGQTFTPRWNGLFGTEVFPSVGQWEEMVNNCSAFIFYGMERFIAQLPPAKVAALNLDECQLALLIDKSQTNKSFRHQSKVDVDKTNTLLSIEKPLQTAMLLSLSGANCVCLNQWHTTSESNAAKLHTFMECVLEQGVTVGQAIRKITNPTLKKPEPVVEEVAPITPALKDGKGKDDKSKRKDSTKPSVSRARSIIPEPTPTETPSLADRIDSVMNDDEAFEEDKESETVTQLDASWCNMVVFGLPNLVVT